MSPFPLILALGCSNPDPADTAADTKWWELEPQSPSWGPEDFAATIEAQVDAGLPTPAPFAAAYAQALANGSEDCPGTTSQITLSEGCTATSGWYYSGVAHYFMDSYSIQLLADMSIVSPEGQRMWGGGGMQHQVIVDSLSTTWRVDINGSWGWSGGEGWMEEGIGSLLSITGNDDASGRQLTVDGSLEDAGRALSLASLSWSTTGCWEYPSGTLLARDDIGGWYRLVLNCEPCGTVKHLDTDTALGEVCLDLTPMRNQVDALSTLESP